MIDSIKVSIFFALFSTAVIIGSWYLMLRFFIENIKLRTKMDALVNNGENKK